MPVGLRLDKVDLIEGAGVFLTYLKLFPTEMLPKSLIKTMSILSSRTVDVKTADCSLGDRFTISSSFSSNSECLGVIDNLLQTRSAT